MKLYYKTYRSASDVWTNRTASSFWLLLTRPVELNETWRLGKNKKTYSPSDDFQSNSSSYRVKVFSAGWCRSIAMYTSSRGRPRLIVHVALWWQDYFARRLADTVYVVSRRKISYTETYLRESFFSPAKWSRALRWLLRATCIPSSLWRY